MANEKRLIDANSYKASLTKWKEDAWKHNERHDAMLIADCLCELEMMPTVDAYTEEQVAQIIKQADKLAAKANELEKEVVWLKSCLNCKIRNVCPRHCGKVVHGCDHWEYGNNAVEVVHGRWLWQKDGEADYEQYWMCSECKDVTFFKTNYCPNCGAEMDGGKDNET